MTTKVAVIPIDLAPLDTATDNADHADVGPSTSTEIDTTSGTTTATTLSVFLARNVSNAAALRAHILTPSCSMDACFIDATLVPSLTVLRAAAAMAVQSLPALKTRTLHAELLWSLGGTKHIGRALSTFGIKDTSRHVLVAKFDAAAGDMEGLMGAVETAEEILGGDGGEGGDGGVGRLEEGLWGVCDVEQVKRVYKVRKSELALGAGEGSKIPGGLVEAVVCRIAARDCS